LNADCRLRIAEFQKKHLIKSSGFRTKFMGHFQVSSFKFHLTTRQRQATGGHKPAAISQQPDKGFTLMEILVATAILAIVVTTVLASFNSVFSTTEVLDESADIYEMAKNCLKRMTLDLESIHVSQRPLYKPPEFDQPPDPYRIVASAENIGGTGFAKTLRFASRAHVGFEKSPRKGIAEVIYYVKAGDNGQLTLKRVDNLYPYPEFEEKGSDPTLCKYVKSLSFKFYDKEGIEFDIWDSDSDEFGYATPTAIAIKLELANSKVSHAFETMVALPISREKTD
jgi:general secretion pathway protein J